MKIKPVAISNVFIFYFLVAFGSAGFAMAMNFFTNNTVWNMLQPRLPHGRRRDRAENVCIRRHLDRQNSQLHLQHWTSLRSGLWWSRFPWRSHRLRPPPPTPLPTPLPIQSPIPHGQSIPPDGRRTLWAWIFLQWPYCCAEIATEDRPHEAVDGERVAGTHLGERQRLLRTRL